MIVQTSEIFSTNHKLMPKGFKDLVQFRNSMLLSNRFSENINLPFDQIKYGFFFVKVNHKVRVTKQRKNTLQ